MPAPTTASPRARQIRYVAARATGTARNTKRTLETRAADTNTAIAQDCATRSPRRRWIIIHAAAMALTMDSLRLSGRSDRSQTTIGALSETKAKKPTSTRPSNVVLPSARRSSRSIQTQQPIAIEVCTNTAPVGVRARE